MRSSGLVRGGSEVCEMSNIYLRQASEFVDRWFRLGGSMPLFLKLLGDDKLMAEMIRHAEEKMHTNPFEQTVEETVNALRAQNEAGNWGIGEDVFARLVETAPAWPKGRDAYRSLRIRFGEGDEGVALTFDRHAEAVKRVHAKFMQWPRLRSSEYPHDGESVERLRLLNGNQTHLAVIEWIVIDDMSTAWMNRDMASMRVPESLADEGVVLAWLFPKRVKAIDYSKWSAWFFAGYELNTPDLNDSPWGWVPCVIRNLDDDIVILTAVHLDGGYTGHSVPFVQK